MSNTPYGMDVEGQETDFQHYLHEIGNYPTLSAQEERILVERIHQGDRAAYDYFLSCNLKLVVSIAKDYANRGLPAMDLIQEGNIGLMHALDKFNPQAGYKFSTYATWWVKQRILRALHEKGLVHVPEYIRLTAAQLHKLEMQLAVKLQREATDEELAEAAGITVDRLIEVRSWMQATLSLDAPWKKHGNKSGAEEEMTLIKHLEDTTQHIQQQSAEESELRAAINQALDMLNTREREVVKLRFGIEQDEGDRTLQEVGNLYRISRERVRQIEVKALDKLTPLLREVAARWLGVAS